MLTVTFQITPGFTCPKQKYKKLIKSICQRFKVKNASISIVVVDNSHIRQINKKFLNRKTTTDVIAFDLTDKCESRKTFELIVNAQKAKSESAKRGHRPEAELALYITHGLLHNLGFDDLNPKDAQKMHRMEDQILQKEGFGRVYKKEV